MLGILYYLIYVIAGLYIGDILLSKYKPYERLSISLAVGTILNVWLPTIVSIITGKFNIFSNIAALALLGSLVAAVYFYNKKHKKVIIKDLYKQWNKKEAFKISLAIIPLMIIIFIIFNGHVLYDIDGSLYGGQSTYGDLSMHMGMITSIANQGIFPPEYSILPGTRLGYPFLVNLQSASMYLFGTSLRFSIIFPSLFLSLSCFLGLYALARDFIKKHSSAALATYLFFITGGLGFIFYLNGDGMMTSLFNEFYMAPTNYTDLNLRWVNIICDMMVPQRTFLIGLSTVLPILLLTKKALDNNSNFQMLFAGIMASALPMIHTHSFLALGIICAGLLFGGAFIYKQNIKNWIIKWGIFLIPVIVFAAPQLFYWIFNQSQSFLRFHLDWVNDGDFWLWFWIKNIGLPFLLIVPAFIHADKKTRLWFICATVIFVIAEIIAFQPNTYDNNKLMLIWYAVTVIIVADCLIMLYNKMQNAAGQKFIAVVVAVVLFASGALTIGREINSNTQYRQYSEVQVECAEFIEQNTATDSLFITGHQHLNEVAALAGRNIYAGSSIYVHFHGLDYSERYYEIKYIYENAAETVTTLKDIGADYIYISSYERYDYTIDNTLYDLYPLVYSSFGIDILAVSENAKSIGTLNID